MKGHYVVANGNCHQTKGLRLSSIWPLGCEVTGLININGGHSEAYIRNAGLGSVPKIANQLFFLSYHSDPSGTIILQKGSFSSQPNRLVCFTLLIAFQVWELILEHLFSRWLTVVV